jgi:hypothetical protein
VEKIVLRPPESVTRFEGERTILGKGEVCDWLGSKSKVALGRYLDKKAAIFENKKINLKSRQ